jgi:hypothetical protein
MITVSICSHWKKPPSTIWAGTVYERFIDTRAEPGGFTINRTVGNQVNVGGCPEFCVQ